MDSSNIFRVLLILAMMIILPGEMSGQKEAASVSFFVQNYSVDDYKGSCQNWDIHVSPKGYLYAANNMGLLEFDGNTWYLHKLQTEEPIYEVGGRHDTIFTKGEHSKGFWTYDEKKNLIYSQVDDSFEMPDISNHNHKTPFLVSDLITKSRPTVYVRLAKYDVVGTENNGIFFLDKAGNILQHLSSQNQLSDNFVHAICVQDESRLWIAFDNGISQLDINPPVSLIGKRSEIGKVANTGLQNDFLYVQTNVGYFRKSLWSDEPFLQVSSNEAEKFLNEKVTSISLSPEKIFSSMDVLEYFKEAKFIYPTYDNMYWTLYKNEAGLFQESNHQTTLKCRLLFDNYNLDLTTRGPHFFTLNDSLYAVSTMQGTMLVDIRQLLNGSNKLTMLRFRKIEYKCRDGLHSLPPDTQKICLEHRFQDVCLYVATTVFTPNHQISYKLEGLGEEWSEWRDDGKITFSNLPEGTYKLRVRKYVTKGPFPELTMIIKVMPAWYNTIWAYISYILLLWLGIQQMLKHNLRRLKKEEKEQKELEDKEKRYRIEQVRQKELEEELQNKKNELVWQTSVLVRRNRLIQSILEEFDSQKEQLGDRYPNKLYNKLHSLIEDALNDKEDWKLFENSFRNAHLHFMEKLQQKYPELTPGDLRVCCLLRMNLSTKEISTLLNISVRAVELRRYRLRKRLNLNNDINLVEFLMNF